MSKFKVHIIILSDQILPNVLPVLDYNLKPDRVILCEGDAMRRRGMGSRLIKFFESKNIRGEIFRLGNADDCRELQKSFQELANKFNSRSAGVAVNLSGGSKMMSLIAQNVFSRHNYTCFYALPHQSELVEMNGGKVQYSQLRDKISLNDYFMSHGCTVSSKREKNLKLVSGSHALCRELLGDFSKYGKHVSYLGRLASGAEDHFSLKAKARISQDNQAVFDLFQRNGFIASFDQSTIEFVSEDDRSFCKGVWLEDYLHQILKSISKDVGLQDFATCFEFRSEAGVRKELDAVFLYKNQLYVIDAKIPRLPERGGDDIFQWESLDGFDDAGTHPIVVSFRELRNFDVKRAKDLGVLLVQGSEISELESKIRSLIGAPDPQK